MCPNNFTFFIELKLAFITLTLFFERKKKKLVRYKTTSHVISFCIMNYDDLILICKKRKINKPIFIIWT